MKTSYLSSMKLYQSMNIFHGGLREAVNNISAKRHKVCILPESRVSKVFHKIMGEVSKIDKDSMREETEQSLMIEPPMASA